MNSCKLLVIAVLLLNACQIPPTKVHETTSNLPVSGEKEVVITRDTVLLDARSLFQYSNGHLPQAIPVRWEDFAKPGSLNKAHLDSDTFSLATRLSKMGVGRDTHVVVAGNGVQGSGEEGRVAWSLAYLGVQNVDFVQESSLQGKRITGEVGIVKNAPMWKPEIVTNLLISEKEMKAQSQKDNLGVLLDVRESSKSLKNAKTKNRRVHIEWKSFFNEKGRPRRSVLGVLSTLGVLPEQKVIVVSDDGVKSAAVTMALRELGFANATNLIQ